MGVICEDLGALTTCKTVQNLLKTICAHCVRLN